MGLHDKQTIKRKAAFQRDFSRVSKLTELLRDAQDRGLLEIEKDKRSGGYLDHRLGPNANPQPRTMSRVSSTPALRRSTRATAVERRAKNP